MLVVTVEECGAEGFDPGLMRNALSYLDDAIRANMQHFHSAASLRPIDVRERWIEKD